MAGEDTQQRFETVKIRVVALLNAHRIPYGNWGKGSAKTLDHLVKEVLAGESVLEAGAGKLSIAYIAVFHTDAHGTKFLLTEEKQIFKDGRERRRILEGSVAEKLLASERPGQEIAGQYGGLAKLPRPAHESRSLLF